MSTPAAVRATPRTHIIYTIAVIGFVFTLHSVIPIYSNSSFLSIYADEQTLGFVYMIAAGVSILGFLIIPSAIRRLGNYSVSIFLVCLQIALIYGLIASTSAVWVYFFFVLQTAVVSLIGLSLDIFLEVYTAGHKVGTIRGLYGATLNASWLVAPLIGTLLINGTNNYRQTFVAALAMVFPLLYLIYRNFPRFKDPHYMHLSPWQLFRHISGNRDWVRLFSANIILQTFYSWMVVYSPIYLNKYIGFSWEEIGVIITVMLIPFPLIQYPLGKLADKKYGEKEIMAIGFGIMGVTTIALSFFTVHSVAVWAILLFCTRIGAASAEVMIETYFFKTVSPRDSAVLGSFRVTRPASYFFAPLITGFGLLFMTHQYLFILVGLMCLIALYPVLTMKDTR